jgi:hypothetical protein
MAEGMAQQVAFALAFLGLSLGPPDVKKNNFSQAGFRFGGVAVKPGLFPTLPGA